MAISPFQDRTGQFEKTNGNETPITGGVPMVDISSWQGDGVEPAKMYEQGIRAMYIRIGGATAVKANKQIWFYDDCAYRNFEKAKAAGMLVGFYWWWTPYAKFPAIEQAYVFYNLIKDFNYDLPPALDCEEKGIPSDFVSRLIVSVEALRSLTKRNVTIYTAPNICDACIKKDTPFSFQLKSTYLWLAHWKVSKPAQVYPWGNCVFWQYEVKSDPTNGLPQYGLKPYQAKALDMDVFFGSIEQLRMLQ